MSRVTDLRQGVDQGALPLGLECKVEVDRRAGRGMTQTLPVDGNSMPGVLDMHIVPSLRGDGHREIQVGEERGSEEG